MFFFKGRFSLHSSDCSTTYYVAQTGLEFRDLPASGIKGCIIMHNLHPLFSQCFKSHLPLLEAPSLVPDSNFLLEMDNGNKSHRPIAPKKVFQRWRGTGQVVLSCRSHLSTRGPQSPVLREASVTTALDKVHTPLTGHQAQPQALHSGWPTCLPEPGRPPGLGHCTYLGLPGSPRRLRWPDDLGSRKQSELLPVRHLQQQQCPARYR